MSDQIKKNKVGEACGTYERKERCIYGFVGMQERKSPL